MRHHCAKTCGICDPNKSTSTSTSTARPQANAKPAGTAATSAAPVATTRVRFASACSVGVGVGGAAPCPAAFACVTTKEEGPVCLCRSGHTCTLPAPAPRPGVRAAATPAHPPPLATVEVEVGAGPARTAATACSTAPFDPGFVCVYIETDDLGFPDAACLCEAGEEALCARRPDGGAKAGAGAGAGSDAGGAATTAAAAAAAAAVGDAAGPEARGGGGGDGAAACTDDLEDGWCLYEWAPCCPGGDGGQQCSDKDCDPNRPAGAPCAGGWMARNCAATCGLCKADGAETARLRAEAEGASRGWHEAIKAGVEERLAHVVMKNKAKAGRGAIIMTTVSMGYLDFFFNWQLSVARVGITNFLVIAEDVAAYHTLTIRIPASQVLLAPDPTAPSGAHTYNTSGYNAMVSRRPVYMRAVTATGHDVMYVDVDTVWASDPFAEFTRNHDLYVQSDVDNPYTDPWSMLCTGLLFVRATPLVDTLLLDWQVALQQRDKGIGSKVDRLLGVNQPIFNRVVRDARKQGLDVKVLDVRKFPSGSIAFGHPKWLSRQMYTPVVYHINYLLGADKKRAMLVRNGLWYV